MSEITQLILCGGRDPDFGRLVGRIFQAISSLLDKKSLFRFTLDAKLTLQAHQQRVEHWVVVKVEVLVTRV